MSENGRATFTVPVAEVEFAKSRAGDGQRTMRGHAAVYDRLSHDLGGFRTKIASGAFDGVLDTNPDVHLLWDHNTRYTLARTKNKTLELRSDPLGLHVWARLADTPTASELTTLMEGGYIDQMSFACDIGSSEWSEDDQGNITRTINTVEALYDVTVCAQGAFPQTDAQMVVSLERARDDLASAIEAGHVSRRDHEEGTELAATLESAEVGDGTAQEGSAAVKDEGTAQVIPAAAATAAPEVVAGRDMAAMKARAKARFAAVTNPD